jgi:hypothetical protein
MVLKVHRDPVQILIISPEMLAIPGDVDMSVNALEGSAYPSRPTSNP